MTIGPIDLVERFPQLTAMQRAVCARTVKGLSPKVIAEQLGISHRTVEDHKHEIYRKMDVKGTPALMLKVFGLEPDDIQIVI